MAALPESGSKPSRSWRSRVLGLLPYVTAALLVWFVASRWDELEHAFAESPGAMVVLIVLVIVGQFMNALEFYLLYRAAGVRIGLEENWSLFSAGQLGNYLPMQIGTLYRFRYLKTVHGHHYMANASTLAMNLLLTVGSTAVCGLVGVAGAVIVDHQRVGWILPVVFAAGLLVALLAAIAPLPKPFARAHHRIAKAWEGFHQGWEVLRRQPRVGAAVLAIDVAKLVILALRFEIAFSFLGIDVSFWALLVIAPIAALASVLAFTPAALGFREVAVTGAAAAMGYSVSTSLLASTVDRAAMLAATVIVGSIGYLRTRHHARRHEQSKGSRAE